MRRGQLLHRLLEALPELPPATRSDTAKHFLAEVADDFSAAEIALMVDEALTVLNDPSFAPVFADGSRPEIDIAAELESNRGPIRLTGRIDRLAVTDHEVMIVDYKTDRPAPIEVDQVRSSYIGQLALYAEAVGRLYPNRRIRAALLWTASPRLMPIPATALSAALEGILSPPTADAGTAGESAA